jgi:NADP-dependent 3-hydroxyisobutyrate dehydrogenase-like protein
MFCWGTPWRLLPKRWRWAKASVFRGQCCLNHCSLRLRVAPFLALKREKIETGNYEPEFPLRWQQKDLHLACVSAYDSDVAMPVTNAVKELYRLAMKAGHATQDFSAIYDYLTDNDKLTSSNAKLASFQEPNSAANPIASGQLHTRVPAKLSRAE